MKRKIQFLLLILGSCLLIIGCSSELPVDDTEGTKPSADIHQNTDSQFAASDEINSLNEPLDNSTNEATSKPSDEVVPNEKQDEYDLSNVLENISSYSLQELFEFYSVADGAYAEGIMAEMMERFTQDPASFLAALEKAEQELQVLITKSLGTSIFFLGKYQNQLYNTVNLDLNKQQKTLLEDIIAFYESAASSMGVVAESPVEETADEDLVRVLDYIPSIYVDLKYATEDNFTGTVIYDFTDGAFLRYGTVKKLMEVEDELLQQGYSLKIWDAYRPVNAQFKLWEVCPDATYVANPNKGYSSHSRGSTIDVTLVMSDGTQITMPSGFDDFSALADRDYSDVSGEAAENAQILEDAMSSHGFNGYSAEWWHYSDSTSYPVVDG